MKTLTNKEIAELFKPGMRLFFEKLGLNPAYATANQGTPIAPLDHGAEMQCSATKKTREHLVYMHGSFQEVEHFKPASGISYSVPYASIGVTGYSNRNDTLFHPRAKTTKIAAPALLELCKQYTPENSRAFDPFLDLATLYETILPGSIELPVSSESASRVGRLFVHICESLGVGVEIREIESNALKFKLDMGAKGSPARKSMMLTLSRDEGLTRLSTLTVTLAPSTVTPDFNTWASSQGYIKEETSTEPEDVLPCLLTLLISAAQAFCLRHCTEQIASQTVCDSTFLQSFDLSRSKRGSLSTVLKIGAGDSPWWLSLHCVGFAPGSYNFSTVKVALYKDQQGKIPSLLPVKSLASCGIFATEEGLKLLESELTY